jgi:hypothetical protein
MHDKRAGKTVMYIVLLESVEGKILRKLVDGRIILKEVEGLFCVD